MDDSNVLDVFAFQQIVSLKRKRDRIWGTSRNKQIYV